MKMKFLAILATMWAFPVQATCLTQETDVELINGVNVKKKDAKRYKNKLHDLIVTTHPEVNPDCIDFNYSYNTNEPFFLDFLEVGLQKAEELTGGPEFFWKQYLRAAPTADWFDDLVATTLFIPIIGGIEAGEYFLGDQVEEHLKAYRREIAPPPEGKGKRLILFGHSQGSGAAALERSRMTPAEQADTFVVSASALAFPEPDSERYTTLDKDNLATAIFALLGAPLANVPLGSATECSDFGSSPWHCHALETVYFALPETRTKIANDIVALLPEAPPLPEEVGVVTGTTKVIFCDGSIIVSPGTFVQLWHEEPDGVFTLVTSTISGHVLGIFRLFAPPGEYIFRHAFGVSPPIVVTAGEETARDHIQSSGFCEA